RSDLHTRPTRAPWAEASIAARSPAPPAPITRTSCSWISYLSIRSSLEEAQVVNHAHGAQANVEIGGADSQGTPPRPRPVMLVENAQEAPCLATRLATGYAREAVELAAHEVAQRMAGSGVHREQAGAGKDDERAQAGAEAAIEPVATRDVVPERNQDE